MAAQARMAIPARNPGANNRAPEEPATEHCLGCGAIVPVSSGPVHPYIASAPGCWALYGEVLAREYGEYGYPPIHRLTVDTYAAQHAGDSSRRARQSVAIHLAGLCLVLERDCTFAEATDAIRALVSAGHDFAWLVPPQFPGDVTIRDVHAASSLVAHVDAVNHWAEAVWLAWSDHHPTIRSWIDQTLRSHRVLSLND